jgi:hypothetical protein
MKMHKREFFLAAMAAGCYRYKQWVLEAFALVADLGQQPRDYDFALHRRDNGSYYWIDTDKSEIDLVGHHPDGPLFSLYDELILQPDDLPNVRQSYVSTYGSALANMYLLVYPFGSQFEYMDGELNPGMFDKLLEKYLVDDKDLATHTGPKITVAQYKLYSQATTMCSEFTQLCVPTATLKTMTVDPAILKRRDELLAQYKDRLHDPVVQAMIGDELIRMDRAWMKGDLGEGFYFKSKSYDIVRKKVFLMQGAEQGFDVQGDFVPTSLAEGWNIQYLPSMANALRDGSYNRGAMTARGGEATKFNYRIFQNTRVTEPDCGSTYGVHTRMHPGLRSYYLGNTAVVNGKSVLLTDTNIDTYMGKTIAVRSPAYCRTEKPNFCVACMGQRLSQNPEAISTYAAGVGSTFMLLSMGAMHGKALTVAKFDKKIHLT